jgi:uncharacterized protein YndB with AHSA1/START domain
MHGKQQLQRHITIDAPVSTVWEVLSEPRLLPDWVPAVNEVIACSADGEAVGAVRQCDVQLAGRRGRMVERCVEFNPMTRAAYVVDEESFGTRRMFADYGFALNTISEGHGRTRVRIDTHYTPRNGFYALVNAVVVRRQFRSVVDGRRVGLKKFSEARHEAEKTHN